MKRKFISVLLTLVMVLSMSLPAFAEEVDLEIDNSADGIYAALQANLAAGSPVITIGSSGKIKINNLNEGTGLTAYKLLSITANANGTIASVDLNHAYDADVWIPLGITSVKDLAEFYQADHSYLSTFMNQLNTASPTLTGGITGLEYGGVVEMSSIPLGMYYIVETTAGEGAYTTTAPMLITVPLKNQGTWYSEVVATAKNSSPGIDKKVKAAEDSVFNDTTDQYTNQKLDYRVEVDGPQWSVPNGQDFDEAFFGLDDNFISQEYLGEFGVCAVPSGVTIDNTDDFASLSAKPGVVDATTWFSVSGSSSIPGYVVANITTATVHNMMTVNPDGSQSAAYKKYVFFYSTMLRNNGVDPVIGEGVPNDARVEYSRDLNNINDHIKLEDRTKAFTYALNIAKYTKNSYGSKYKLPGAEFQILRGADTLWFSCQTLGEYGYWTSDTTGFTYYDDTTFTNVVPGPTPYAKNDSGVSLTTNLVTNGSSSEGVSPNLYIAGLDDGTYTIKEVKAPSGYSPISDFNITLTGVVDFTGNKTGSLQPITVEGVWISGATGTLTFSILDPESILGGITLPSTGGAGIIIFTLTGMAILLGCEAAYLVRKSRKRYTQK